MKIIDLSHRVTPAMQIYPGDPEVGMEQHLSFAADGCRVKRLHLGSHSGTHVDAPSHFLEHGPTLSEISIDRFVGRGILVDVRNRQPGEQLDAICIDPYRAAITPGSFVIFWTGWDMYWNTEIYLQHPHLSAELADELKNLKTGLVAIDALNVDPTTDNTFSAHELLLAENILIVENLCNLRKVNGLSGIYSFLPIHLEGADGAPVRAAFLCSAQQ